MRRISFCRNWNNKLDCDYFSTIRLRNDLVNVLNDIVTVELKDKKNPKTFKARIAYMNHFTLDKLKPAMAYIDMAYPVDKAKTILYRMYSNKVVDITKQEFTFMILQKQ